MSIRFHTNKVVLGTVIGGINQRRGTIVDTEVRDDEFTATCEVSLNDMFGYASNLRGMTQGKGEFSMEYKVRSYSHNYNIPHFKLQYFLDSSTGHAQRPKRYDRRVQEEAIREEQIDIVTLLIVCSFRLAFLLI